MNVQTHSTAAPPRAIDWQAELDEIADIAQPLVHSSNFLMRDLELAFDTKRGRRAGPETEGDLFDFTFPTDRIEATLWLAGEVWLATKELQGRLIDLQKRLDLIDFARAPK